MSDLLVVYLYHGRLIVFPIHQVKLESNVVADWLQEGAMASESPGWERVARGSGTGRAEIFTYRHPSLRHV